MLLITQSVDNIVVATEAAFFKALFVTSKGSIIPDRTILTVLPVTTFIPLPVPFGNCISVTPAFFSIVVKGTQHAFSSTCSPVLLAFMVCAAFNNATPPPGIIPSLIAALVAQIASSTLSLFSFNSTSELAPTLTTATFADNLAILFS